MQLVDFGAEAHGGGLVGVGEEGGVFGAVEEGALGVDEVRGEEDVGAEGGEEGVEFGGGGREEGGEGACAGGVVSVRVGKDTLGSEGKCRWGWEPVYRVCVGLALWPGFGLGGFELRDGGGRDGIEWDRRG